MTPRMRKAFASLSTGAPPRRDRASTRNSRRLRHAACLGADMKQSLAGTLLLVVAIWSTMAGCESEADDTPGTGGAAGGQGGEAGLAGEGGLAAGQAGEGGTAGQGGDGGTAGQGGARPPTCPVAIVAAEGDDCSQFGEGFECSDGSTNPCEFGNAIVCVNGIWERRESFPAPCGGAGGSDFAP